jgi:hypothetical protein
MEQQPQSGSEIILYQTEDGHPRLEVKLVNNTVWLSLNQIAELPATTAFFFLDADGSTLVSGLDSAFALGLGSPLA